jgi:hypothetical protein
MSPARPLKITHRITALFHQFTDELFGLDNHSLGVIDESALHSVPGFAESGSFRRRQRK